MKTLIALCLTLGAFDTDPPTVIRRVVIDFPVHPIVTPNRVAADDLTVPPGTPPGLDLSGYTAGELREIFGTPMNRSGTFEPLVFATRSDAIDYRKGR